MNRKKKELPMAAVCYNCFRKTSTYGLCPSCGYDPENGKKYPLALKPGSILNGRYIVGRALGQGGFGITYIAQDYRTKKRVAIKEYLPAEFAGRTRNSAVQPHSGDQQENFEYGKQQFLIEAKTLAEVGEDEHIVRIYSYFEENSTAYFVMEYVAGKPLNDYMAKEGGRLSFGETCRLLLPLMESLNSVHARGIIHRDIAPDNIIITDEEETAKLIDFGAARYSTGEKSRSLDVILKHGFAPKEQYTRHGRQGPYTDIYAMAATWYYAMTGIIPPESIDRMEEDELVLPCDLGIELPGKAEEVLLKGLEVNAQNRWQSMEEFRTAMEEIVREEGPCGKPQGLRYERGAFKKRESDNITDTGVINQVQSDSNVLDKKDHIKTLLILCALPLFFLTVWYLNNPVSAPSPDPAGYIESPGPSPNPTALYFITLTAVSDEKVYDGKPLVNKNVKATALGEKDHKLSADYEIYDSSGNSIKGDPVDAGVYTKKVGNIRITARGIDITDQYSITTVDGTLTILPAASEPPASESIQPVDNSMQAYHFDAEDDEGIGADLSVPGRHDMENADPQVVVPEGSNWLEEYETRYVKSDKGYAIILRYEPVMEYISSSGESHYIEKIPEASCVTLLARQGEFSLIRTEGGSIGWVQSKHLVPSY